MSDEPQNSKPEESPGPERALSIPPELPVLPLRDTVLFPNSFMPLAVARESSVRLIDDAIGGGRLIAVFTQKDAAVEEPGRDDLYQVGTATHIHKMFKLPDGSLRLIVQGLARLRLEELDLAEALPGGPRQHRRRGVERRRPARSRRPAAEHQDQLPEGRVAVAAPLGRPADARDEHHRARPARRLHRLEPHDHRHRRQAVGARDPRRPHAARLAQPDPDQGARGARARLEDPEPGPVRGRPQPARVLPARADEGDPEGAGRGRRAGEGDRGTPREDRRGGHAGGGEARRRCASSTGSRGCRWRPPSTPCRGPTSTGWSRSRGRSAPTR